MPLLPCYFLFVDLLPSSCALGHHCSSRSQKTPNLLQARVTLARGPRPPPITMGTTGQAPI